MKLKAYIMASDPTWIEESVLAYYDAVEEIIVSYDENGLGWTGVPIAVEECLGKLRALDAKGKMRFCPGHYARTEHSPMDNDTYQRQCALDAASEDADWIIQLDTDEILTDTQEFLSCLAEAEQRGFQGMDYPARWIYYRLGNNRYLEACRRTWATMAGYPGPVAVRSHTQLRHARQCDVSLFRVDFRAKNTDPWHPKDTPVHRVVSLSQGIVHLSMARNEERLRNKTQAWSHARDTNWDPKIKHWAWSGRHPYLATFMTPFVRHQHWCHNHLRLVKIKLPDFKALRQGIRQGEVGKLSQTDA